MSATSLVRYWTLQSPDGRLASCELFRTDTGLEVRCDLTGEGAPAGVPRVVSITAITDALAVAEAWRAAYVANGWLARSAPPGKTS
jgi:hypothetical protein